MIKTNYINNFNNLVKKRIKLNKNKSIKNFYNNFNDIKSKCKFRNSKFKNSIIHVI